MDTVRKGHLTSGWLHRYIRERGGVMNVTIRPCIVG
jgi:hypothetical protein